MISSSRSPRRWAFQPACDCMESRELLNGTMGLVVPASMPSASVLAQQNDGPGHEFRSPIITRLSQAPVTSVSTVPSNGDVNPYGVAFVPNGFPKGGPLKPGDILVSNFNNSKNLQGTGTTIVRITPQGQQSVFFQGPQGLGLTTALGILKRGFVIVGNLPATYDANNNLTGIGNGSLLILDRNGKQLMELADPKLLQGPWDLTINDRGNFAQVFVSNVLSGTVTRINLSIHPNSSDPIVVESMTQIASGYVHRPDPAALVVGPTGLAYDARREILYVASTGDNKIFAISEANERQSDAGTGRVVYRDQAHLRGPLGLALLPNGDLLTTNGDAVKGDPNQPSELIEFTPHGRFVGQFSLDPAQGAAFGLAPNVTDRTLTLATVNDDTNSLDLRFVPFKQN